MTLITGFNLNTDDVHLESFLQSYDLTSFIKEPTYFQSTDLTCIDLILTNQKMRTNALTILKLDCLITIN